LLAVLIQSLPGFKWRAPDRKDVMSSVCQYIYALCTSTLYLHFSSFVFHHEWTNCAV